MIKRINKYLYFFLLGIIFLISCTDRFCRKFEDGIKSQCNSGNDKCYINLNKVFNFDWDSLYVFDSELYPDEVSKRLGTNCDCKTISEGHRRIYFTKGGKIVKQYTSTCFKVNFVEKKNEIGDGVVVLDSRSSFLLEKRLINNEISYYLFKQ